MTDGAKATVWQAEWSPWGAPLSITASPEMNQRFPGQWFQLEAGLHYNWHRHYDPSLGRYTQPDPLGFVDGPSVFAYARNNPQMYVDPDGRFVLFFEGGGNVTGGPAGGAAGGGAAYDTSTGTLSGYANFGWQAGLNTGITVAQFGYFSGGLTDFFGEAIELQCSLGPMNCSILIIKDQCGNTKHWGIGIGVGAGVPFGFLGGKITTVPRSPTLQWRE